MKNYTIGTILVIAGAFGCMAAKQFTENKLAFFSSVAVIIVGTLFQAYALVAAKKDFNELARKYEQLTGRQK